MEDGVADGGCHSHYRRFAGACWSDVFAIEKDGLDVGDVAEARDAVAGEMRIGDAAVLKFDGFKERAAETLNVRADDLIAEAVGIDDGAAFESGDQAHDANCSRVFVHGDFGAGGYVTSLFVSGGDAEAAIFFLRLRPAECFRGSFQDGTEPGVFEVFQPK